jgi:hypothetical protein
MQHGRGQLKLSDFGGPASRALCTTSQELHSCHTNTLAAGGIMLPAIRTFDRLRQIASAGPEYAQHTRRLKRSYARRTEGDLDAERLSGLDFGACQSFPC